MWVDIGSGLSTKSRPDFLDMLEYCLDPANGVTDVVFWDLDRFTRNIEEFFTYTKGLIDAGITLHIALDGEKYDYQSAERWHQRLVKRPGRIQENVQTCQARPATSHRAGLPRGTPTLGLQAPSMNRTRKTSPKNCERSIAPTAKEGSSNAAGWVPDPDKWDDVVRFWDQVTQGHTPMRVAIYMNLHNIPAPKGGQWTDETVRRVIRNPKYYGKLFRGVKPQSRIPGPKENAPPIIVEDNHIGAVDYDAWLEANQAIDARRPATAPSPLTFQPEPAQQPGQMRRLQIAGHSFKPRTRQNQWR